MHIHSSMDGPARRAAVKSNIMLDSPPIPIDALVALARHRHEAADKAEVLRRRRRIEAAVTGLIALLDALDGENEHGGNVLDEPHDAEEDSGIDDERHDDFYEDDEDGADDELTAPEGQVKGFAWARGTDDDEKDEDIEQDILDQPQDGWCGDDEPSLGSGAASEHLSQQHWGEGNTFDTDAELDDADLEDGGDAEPDGGPGRFVRKVATKVAEGEGYGFDPRFMSERYCVRGDGVCLEPEVRNGQFLEVEPTDGPIRPGEIAMIYFKRGVKSGHQSWMKKMVMDLRHPRAGCRLASGEPGIIVEMLNPPQTFQIPADAIVAVHRVVRVLPDDTPTYKETAGQTMAQAALTIAARKAL